MKQEQFTQAHQEQWARFQAMLAPSKTPVPGAEALPAAYRRICQHLALARQRCYSAGLIQHLNGLVMAGHRRLYGSTLSLGPAWVAFLAGGLARRTRTLFRPVLLALLLFGLPTAVLPVAIQRNPELAYLVADPQTLAGMEAMYRSDSGKFGRSNAGETDVAMFGFYIWNNVRITFQVFAGGILLGLGSILFLVSNGVHGGAVAGYLTHVGLGHNFWPFVATHSALELPSLILAGGAGLHLGWAQLAPGRRSRGQALREATRNAMPLVYGAALMDVVAALIEAFWSSSAQLAPGLKVGAGALLWAAVLGYFAFAGRRHA